MWSKLNAHEWITIPCPRFNCNFNYISKRLFLVFSPRWFQSFRLPVSWLHADEKCLFQFFFSASVVKISQTKNSAPEHVLIYHFTPFTLHRQTNCFQQYWHRFRFTVSIALAFAINSPRHYLTHGTMKTILKNIATFFFFLSLLSPLRKQGARHEGHQNDNNLHQQKSCFSRTGLWITRYIIG